ncbi:MAG: trimethylamine methyltransferase family protein [Chloroflexi bacterium]|nr:trimethylamine methyltransferase family protein [Chloroflexota bacterium]
MNSLALPQLQMLTREQCQIVHDASLEILRRTGVRVFHEEALNLLREAGAEVGAGKLVKIPGTLVDWALKEVPSSVTLHKRGSDEAAARLAEKNVSLGTGSDCLHYLDPRTGNSRNFTAEDVAACVRLCDVLSEINFVMSMGIPSDLGSANVYRRQFAIMLQNTVKPIVFVADTRADCEAIVAMAAAVAGGLVQLRRHPTLLLYSEPTTPLQHSQTATEKLLYMAEQSLPVVHSPAPMMGGTAPVTLAGGLALGNAEALSSLVIHQLKRRGAPFVYGTGLHHLDMKTAISVYGAPEFQLARVAVAEMGRFYRMPTWGYAGHSDSQVMDEQAASDATLSVLIALLSGTNLVHDIGYLEAGLTTSPEMIVFTDEVIAMMRHFVSGFGLDGESLALEVIDRVGPGGNYLDDDHTFEHFREFWQPTLFDRQRAEPWRAGGSQRLGERLRDKTIALMESHRPEPLSASVAEEIERILR